MLCAAAGRRPLALIGLVHGRPGARHWQPTVRQISAGLMLCPHALRCAPCCAGCLTRAAESLATRRPGSGSTASRPRRAGALLDGAFLSVWPWGFEALGLNGARGLESLNIHPQDTLAAARPCLAPRLLQPSCAPLAHHSLFRSRRLPLPAPTAFPRRPPRANSTGVTGLYAVALSLSTPPSGPRPDREPCPPSLLSSSLCHNKQRSTHALAFLPDSSPSARSDPRERSTDSEGLGLDSQQPPAGASLPMALEGAGLGGRRYRMAGLGFGLPLSRLYARYFGGWGWAAWGCGLGEGKGRGGNGGRSRCRQRGCIYGLGPLPPLGRSLLHRRRAIALPLEHDALTAS